jgi:hypothetical protein
MKLREYLRTLARTDALATDAGCYCSSDSGSLTPTVDQTTIETLTPEDRMFDGGDLEPFVAAVRTSAEVAAQPMTSAHYEPARRPGRDELYETTGIV